MREFKQELFCETTGSVTNASVKLSPFGITVKFDDSRHFVGDGDVHVELYDGSVRAVAWADENREDPTHTIVFPVDLDEKSTGFNLEHYKAGMAVWWEDPEGSCSGVRQIESLPSEEDIEELEADEIVIELNGCQALLKEVRAATAAEINEWLVDSR